MAVKQNLKEFHIQMVNTLEGQQETGLIEGATCTYFCFFGKPFEEGNGKGDLIDEYNIKWVPPMLPQHNHRNIHHSDNRK